MLTCYIIDDEPHAIRSLRTYIEKTPILHLTGSSEDPLAALSHFQESNEYADITFLDIDMSGISGIEMSALLKGKTAIVFTTAHPDFAIEAFELEISDYLLKPYSYERFVKCVYRINDLIEQRKPKTKIAAEDFFYIQTEAKGKLVKVLFRDILYVESQKNYVSIAIQDKKYLTYLTLAEIEDKLPASFLRISKSYIINTDKISHLEGNQIYLNNIKEGFIMSPNYKDSFSDYMKEHLIKTKRL